MAFLPSSLLLLIYASSQLPQATQAFPYPRREANGFQLSSQLTNFIPACAQPCFLSFLDVNFNSSRLGTSPNLDTLCSHNSSSGYTIGEGAVECIIGEDDAGGCSKTGVGDDDGSSAVIQRAYGMCDGEKAALPNTHSTLVATLFTSGTVVLVAPTSTESSSATTTSKTSTTTTTSRASTRSYPGTITAPTSTPASTIPITTATGSPTLVSSFTSTSSSTSVSSPTTALPASSSTGALSPSNSSNSVSKSKVTGIAVGSSIGAVAFVGLCIYLAYMRKRRNRNRDSDIFPFTPESNNSLAARRFTDYSRRHGQIEKGQGSPGFAPGGTRDGVAAKISPTFHPRVVTPPLNGPTIRLVEDRHFLPTTRASRIGLAVSAEPSPATLMPPPNFTDTRHSSKLLPERPTLALQIPNQTHSRPGQVFKFPSPPRSQKKSIMERGRPKIEFGPPMDGPSYSSSNSNQSSQSQGNGSRQGENRLSEEFQPHMQNTPYYPGNVTTPYEQNMALRKYLASDQNLHIRPLEIRRSVSVQQHQPPQFRGAFSQANNQGMTNTYPTRPPNAYQPGSIPPQNNSQPQKSSYNAYQKPSQRPGRDSTGSVTSFESFSSGDDVEIMSPGGTITVAPKKPANPDRRKSSKTNLKELSPVKESPSPGTPVSYPRIPGRLGSTVRAIPPPPKPDFTKVMGSGSVVVARKPVPLPTSLQSGSLTYGGGVGNGGEKPWRQAELAAAAMRRSKYGSIYGGNGISPTFAPQSGQQLPPPPDATAPPMPDYSTLPSQRGMQFQGPAYLQAVEGNADRASTASTNSSLLATKRRGEKLAAGLVLRSNNDAGSLNPFASQAQREQQQNRNANNNGNGNRNSWRVLRDEETTGWRPQVARQGKPTQVARNPYRMSRDIFLDDDAGFSGRGKENEPQSQSEGKDPGTPGWKPRLTPTRRGDELFLSVQ